MNDDSFIPASRMSKRQATLSFGTVVATKRAKVDSPPFSLETFSANLSTAPPKGSSGSVSVRELLALECETLDESWIAGLSKELEKPYFLKLKQFLWEEGVRGVGGTEVKGKKKVFPPAADIYAWSRFTTLPNVRVVILGQDPYHDDNQAMGLSFSVRRSITKIPPSLRNIYKEISTNYPSFSIPSHGDLTNWAAQGVLLLNSSLTVRAHEANSHGKAGWETFTDKVVDAVNAREGNGVVFLAWGAAAGKRMARIDKARHLVLESAHPSPLSAHRGFLGNGHFLKANQWLEKKYGKEAMIDWSKLAAVPAPPRKIIAPPVLAPVPIASSSKDILE